MPNELNINKIVYSADDPKTILQLLNQCASAINGIIDYYQFIKGNRYFRHKVSIQNQGSGETDIFYFNSTSPEPITSATVLFENIIVTDTTYYYRASESEYCLVTNKDSSTFTYYSSTASNDYEIERYSEFNSTCEDEVTQLV